MYHVLGIDYRHEFYDAAPAADPDPQRGQADRGVDLAAVFLSPGRDARK